MKRLGVRFLLCKIEIFVTMSQERIQGYEAETRQLPKLKNKTAFNKA